MLQIAKNLNQMTNSIETLVADASEEVLISFSQELISINLFEKKSKNVPIKKIDSLNNISLYGYQNLQRFADVYDKISLKFISSEKITQQFSLVDNKIISFLNPYNNPLCIGQTIYNRHLGVKYKQEFFNMFNNAIPICLLINSFVQTKESLMHIAKKFLIKDEIDVLENIIEHGILSKNKNFTTNQKINIFIKKFNDYVVSNYRQTSNHI
jgi:hypothetical protein